MQTKQAKEQINEQEEEISDLIEKFKAKRGSLSRQSSRDSGALASSSGAAIEKASDQKKPIKAETAAAASNPGDNAASKPHVTPPKTKPTDNPPPAKVSKTTASSTPRVQVKTEDAQKADAESTPKVGAHEASKDDAVKGSRRRELEPASSHSSSSAAKRQRLDPDTTSQSKKATQPQPQSQSSKQPDGSGKEPTTAASSKDQRKTGSSLQKPAVSSTEHEPAEQTPRKQQEGSASQAPDSKAQSAGAASQQASKRMPGGREAAADQNLEPAKKQQRTNVEDSNKEPAEAAQSQQAAATTGTDLAIIEIPAAKKRPSQPKKDEPPAENLPPGVTTLANLERVHALPAEASEETATKRPRSPTMQICQDFLKDMCNDEDCPYRHPPKPKAKLQSAPPRLSRAKLTAAAARLEPPGDVDPLPPPPPPDPRSKEGRKQKEVDERKQAKFAEQQKKEEPPVALTYLQPSNNVVKVCLPFLEGRCDDEQCELRHFPSSPEELDDWRARCKGGLPCRWGIGCKRRRCRYFHPKSP